jgi:GLPGLI family protein
MKRKSLLWLFGIGLCFGSLPAQNLEGLIVYTEDIKFDFSAKNAEATPNPQAKQFQAMLGEGVNWSSNLRIQGGKTLFLPDPNEVTTAPPPGKEDFGSMMRQNMKSKDEVYRDTESGELLESTDFMGKKFLVSGSPQIKWKMTTEQMTILGYPCFKAIGNPGDTVVGPIEAWYTPALAVSSGPKNYGGLPGLILAVKGGDNGAYVVFASKIDLRPLTAEEPIAKPDKGKAMTREEFILTKQEKMKEMEGMFRNGAGGRPPMMMMTR